jgi:hypothetical protein
MDGRQDIFVSKTEYVRFWGPRIGDDAARLLFHAFWLRLSAVLSGWVWFPCLVIGRGHHVLALSVVGAIAMFACAVLLVLFPIWRHWGKAVAGRCLGRTIGVGKIPLPPGSRQGYEAWCNRYAVTPYAANDYKTTKSKAGGP